MVPQAKIKSRIGIGSRHRENGLDQSARRLPVHLVMDLQPLPAGRQAKVLDKRRIAETTRHFQSDAGGAVFGDADARGLGHNTAWRLADNIPFDLPGRPVRRKIIEVLKLRRSA